MNQPDFSLDGKTILITGAARGLGAAIAEVCGAQGARLCLQDLNSEAVEATADRLRSQGADFGADGICVNAIAPGYVLTEMNKKILSDEGFVRRIENRTPAARWAEPAEITAPVAFLMSDAASYINGQLLAVDGGMNAFLQSNEG